MNEVKHNKDELKFYARNYYSHFLELANKYYYTDKSFYNDTVYPILKKFERNHHVIQNESYNEK